MMVCLLIAALQTLDHPLELRVTLDVNLSGLVGHVALHLHQHLAIDTLTMKGASMPCTNNIAKCYCSRAI